MIRRILGAAFGGTTRGGHHGCESLALSLITPPNFGGTGGSCLPSIVIVALGEPGVPLICWAVAPGERAEPRTTINDSSIEVLTILILLGWPQHTSARTTELAKGSRLTSQELGQPARRGCFERKGSANQRGNKILKRSQSEI